MNLQIKICLLTMCFSLVVCEDPNADGFKSCIITSPTKTIIDTVTPSFDCVCRKKSQNDNPYELCTRGNRGENLEKIFDMDNCELLRVDFDVKGDYFDQKYKYELFDFNNREIMYPEFSGECYHQRGYIINKINASKVIFKMTVTATVNVPELIIGISCAKEKTNTYLLILGIVFGAILFCLCLGCAIVGCYMLCKKKETPGTTEPVA
jgi:hypothetical protein